VKNLHVILDEEYLKNISLKVDDIYLLKDGLDYCEAKNVMHASNYLFSRDKIFKHSQDMLHIFNQFESDYFRSVNQMFINTFLPMYRVFNAIDKIIEESEIKSIVLYGGRSDYEFIPAYLAEGETHRILMYKSAWYVNYFIYKRYTKIAKVNFYTQTSKATLVFSSFVRRHVLLLYKLLLIVKKTIACTLFSKNYIPKLHPDKKILFFPVRSVAQINSVESIYKKFNKKINVVFVIYDRLLSTDNDTFEYLVGKNYNIIQLRKQNFIFMLFVIFRNFKHALTESRRVKINKEHFNIFSYQEILKELVFLNFEKNIYKELLNRKFSQYSKYDCFVFSTEIFLPEAFIENHSARQNNFKSCNSQSQQLLDPPLPTFEMGGDFFLFDEMKTYDLFNLYNYRGIEYFGSFKYFDLINSSKHEKKRKYWNLSKLVFLTQPINFEIQGLIIGKIIETLLIGQSLYIKIHPRDEHDYSKFIDNKRVFRTEKSPKLVIKEYDVIISRTTSLLLDGLLSNKICFSIQLSEYDKLFVNYIDNKYLKIINNFDDISKLQVFIKEECMIKTVRYEELMNDMYVKNEFSIMFNNILELKEG
jgi:hypothetical protein